MKKEIDSVNKQANHSHKERNEKTQALRDLRVADLELFITAAHLKNLSQAAAYHHLSQSAASTAIQRVEYAFGRPLSEHKKRQFLLTPEGLDILPRAEAWLRQLSEAVVTSDPLPIRIVTTHAIARASMLSVALQEKIHLELMRPDNAYSAVARGEADVALVPDNAVWEGVIATEVGKGSFQLYSSRVNPSISPVILPENQIEVLSLQQRWQQVYGKPLPIKARLPSWSLIADLCVESNEIGFLPDFLGHKFQLHPVPWQPAPSRYRLLALYRSTNESFQKRLDVLLREWRKVFSE